MSFKGEFEKRISARVKGAIIYSFTLTNTSWMGSETIDFMLCDSTGVQKKHFRGITLKAGYRMRVDSDTSDWGWCQGDIFAILGRNDKIKEHWQLKIKEYQPGNCPECRGSHKCSHCSGQGVHFDFNNGVTSCPHCGGTGICQTCYVPKRTIPSYTPQQPAADGNARSRSHRPTSVIQAEIMDVQRQIDEIEWRQRMRDINGRTVGTALSSSENQLQYRLQIRLVNLQQELAASYN